MSSTSLRDPTAESSPTRRSRLAPPASLDGKVVALMDIGKSRGVEFLDRLEGGRACSGEGREGIMQETEAINAVIGNDQIRFEWQNFSRQAVDTMAKIISRDSSIDDFHSAPGMKVFLD